MAEHTQDISIHTKKFYRVILRSVNLENESPEGMAIKLSMRLRMPLPRAKQLLNNLPREVSSGLTIQKANKLYHALQALGGIAEVQPYFVTPGSTSGQNRNKRGLDSIGVKRGKQVIICPACGWEESIEAEYCSLCFKKFKEKLFAGKASRAFKKPIDNPQSEGESKRGNHDLPKLSELLNNKVFLAAGITILALLVLLILK